MNNTIKTNILSILICLCITSFFAQTNLIVNPSFEDHSCVPEYANDGASPLSFSCCLGWKVFTGTPEYYSIYSTIYNPLCALSSIPLLNNITVAIPKNCFGFQNPKSGDFYIGFLTYAICGYCAENIVQETIYGNLANSLSANHIYEFSLYWSLANSCAVATNQLQAYFTKNKPPPYAGISTLDSIPYYFPKGYTSQVAWDTTLYMTDTLNWVKLSGCFIAMGGEKYISIGNFRKKSQTSYFTQGYDNSFICHNYSFGGNISASACISTEDTSRKFSYYYIDDLSLYDRGYYSGVARCIRDTVVCKNTAVVIGNNIADSSQYTWYPTTALSCSTCPNPTASPSVTTTYVVKKQLCSYISYDTVVVKVAPYPSPANAGNDITLCSEQNSLIGTADTLSGFITYSWSPSQYLSCSTCPQTWVSIPQPDTVYYVLTKTFCDSVSKDTVSVMVNACSTTYTIPNIFTPNGDNSNDMWGIEFKYPEAVKDFKLSVFNRWGVKLYEADKPNAKWDGRSLSGEPVPTGTYYYVAEFIINPTQGGKKQEAKGYFTLMR